MSTNEIGPLVATSQKKRKGVRLAHRQLTQSQWYTTLISVGLTPARAKIGSAIIMAESGGRLDAVNHNSNGSTDYGGPQINSVNGIPRSRLRTARQQALAMKKLSKNGTDWHPWTTYNSGAYRKFMGTKLKNTGNVPTGATPAERVNAGGATSLPSAQLTAFEGGLPGTTLSQPVSFLGDVGGAVSSAAGDVLNPIGSAADILGGDNPLGNTVGNLFPQQILDFFRLSNRLFEPKFWYQVGKVLLGLIALWIGANSLLKISTGVDVGKSVKHGVETAAAAAIAAPK